MFGRVVVVIVVVTVVLGVVITAVVVAGIGVGLMHSILGFALDADFSRVESVSVISPTAISPRPEEKKK